MTSNAKTIWILLRRAGMTETAAAAMLGNMQAESTLLSNNAQNGMTKLSDSEYTRSVDNGLLDFVNDKVGYGLCQWTYPARKRALLNFARAEGASIGDLTMQVDFCIKELRQDFAGLWSYLCGTPELFTAVSRICREFERPAVNNISDRLKFAENWYTALKGLIEEPARPESEYWPPRTIDVGMSGPDVLLWQALLQARGYECPLEDPFGEATKAATIEYQTAAGLKPDGIPGPLTWTEGLTLEEEK